MRIAVVIEDNFYWRKVFANTLSFTDFQVKTADTFFDDLDANVFIVGAVQSYRVVGPEYVARLRVSHPEAVIIVTGMELNTTPPRATMTVGEQCIAAGADAVLDTNNYTKEALIRLLPQ